jgi:hypothetical protein
VYERQTQTDRQRREPLGGARVGGAEDDDQEHERHDDFRDQGRGQRIAAGRMLRVAIGGQAAAQIKARLAACDEIKQRGGQYRTEHWTMT